MLGDRFEYLLIAIVSLCIITASTKYMDAGYPTRITCFTCKNASSNAACNQGAVDRPCPADLPSCLTKHSHSNGRTISVDKYCSKKLDCHRMTGCYRDHYNQMCISCCEESYCNENIPWDQTQARFIRSQANSSTSPHTHISFLFLFIIIINYIL